MKRARSSFDVSSNEYLDASPNATSNLIVLKRSRQEPKCHFYNIPIELYQCIIRCDPKLLNTMLQVSRRISSAICENKKFLLRDINVVYNSRQKLLSLCFRKGYAQIIRMMYSSMNKPSFLSNKKFLLMTLQYGQLPLLSLFDKKDKPKDTEKKIIRALQYSNYESLYTFYKGGYHLSKQDTAKLLPYLYQHFFHNGFMESLCESLPPKNEYPYELYYAIVCQNFKLFKWYVQKCNYKMDLQCFYMSIFGKNLDIFEYIISIKPEYLDNILQNIDSITFKVGNGNGHGNCNPVRQRILQILVENELFDKNDYINSALKNDSPQALDDIDGHLFIQDYRLILLYAHKHKKYSIIRYLSLGLPYGLSQHKIEQLEIKENIDYYYMKKIQMQVALVEEGNLEMAWNWSNSELYWSGQLITCLIKLGFEIPPEYKNFIYTTAVKYSNSMYRELLRSKKTIHDFTKWGIERYPDEFSIKLHNKIMQLHP